MVFERIVGGRPFWFTTEEAQRESLDRGEWAPTGRHYVTFSPSRPSSTIPGEVLKDGVGRAQLFGSAEEALAAGIQEVETRLRLPAKAYAVGLPTGSTDQEEAAYLQLLQDSGIDISDGRRAEDSFGRKWLHLWNTREQAEQFASRLRRTTRNTAWEVFELSPPDLQPRVDILVGRQGDGVTYGLHPTSLKLIRQRFPGARPRSSLFLSQDARTAYEVTNGASYDQIATLLTGLPASRLGELGGYRVVDPVSGLIVRETDALSAG